MANGETEKLNTGALKIELDLEKQIRFEIDQQFPNLTSSEKEALVKSRLKISSPQSRPNLIKVDLGQGAGRKIKEDLFE